MRNSKIKQKFVYSLFCKHCKACWANRKENLFIPYHYKTRLLTESKTKSDRCNSYLQSAFRITTESSSLCREIMIFCKKMIKQLEPLSLFISIFPVQLFYERITLLSSRSMTIRPRSNLFSKGTSLSIR